MADARGRAFKQVTHHISECSEPHSFQITVTLAKVRSSSWVSILKPPPDSAQLVQVTEFQVSPESLPEAIGDVTLLEERECSQ